MDKGFDKVKDLVKSSRSYRRFIKEPVGKEVLYEMVDLARLSASAANLQPLKYMLSCEKEMNELIFPTLGWAAYLKSWKGPEEGERPSAYIIVLGDKEIATSFGCDHGIATQNIILGATGKGLGCCIIGAVDRSKLRNILGIPERYDILHVIAIGRPGEEVRIEKVPEDGNIRYWRDDKGIHHVPKRALDDIIVSVKA